MSPEEEYLEKFIKNSPALKILMDYMGITSSSLENHFDFPYMFRLLGQSIQKMEYPDQEDLVYYYSMLCIMCMGHKYNEQGLRHVPR